MAREIRSLSSQPHQRAADPEEDGKAQQKNDLVEHSRSPNRMMVVAAAPLASLHHPGASNLVARPSVPERAFLRLMPVTARSSSRF